MTYVVGTPTYLWILTPVLTNEKSRTFNPTSCTWELNSQELQVLFECLDGR